MTTQNNQQLRALLTLPPIQPSANTSLVVPEMPRQEAVTGDLEVDAVLWLQKVVATGNQALIDKALEAAKKIKTPMDELGRRYTDHVSRASGGHFGAVLATFGFGDIEGKAKNAIERANHRREALARFGSEEALFVELPAERECRLALKQLKCDDFGMYDDAMACDRFEKRPKLVPASTDDCLYIIEFWDHLYRLRSSIGRNDHYENTKQAYAHECYAFFMLGDIQPRNKEEAVAAFEYVQASDRKEWAEVDGILRNLIVSGWRAPSGTKGEQV